MRSTSIMRSLLAIALFVSTLAPTHAGAQDRQRQPQPRPHGQRVEIDPAKIHVDDGDTAEIQWGEGDVERVRFLGIDTPETRHPQVNLPYAQSFGEEARAFAIGAFAVATQVELLRADMLDPYGRTLGYFFLNGKNYSILIIAAGLAEESVTRYGDNGFPDQAQAVIEAARAAGPPPFESPSSFRRRMREVSESMKQKGTYPEN